MTFINSGIAFREEVGHKRETSQVAKKVSSSFKLDKQKRVNSDSEGTQVTWKRWVMVLKGKRRKVL